MKEKGIERKSFELEVKCAIDIMSKGERIETSEGKIVKIE